MSEKPILFNTEMVKAILEGRKTQTRRIVKNQLLSEEQLKKCGKPCYPGDILYVRETWTEDGRNFYYRADFESDWLDPCETLSGGYPIYCSYHPECEGCTREKQRIHWHPSIHMPKEAARIWLKVKAVKVQRLQDITNDDAKAEGVTCATDNSGMMHRHKFRVLWDSIADTQTSWEANPYVWAYTFERIDNPREAKA